MSIDNNLLAITVMILIILVWHSSPIKKKCHNACHAKPTLSAFSWPAIWDVLKYGVSQGLWCFATCWALMALPLFFNEGHFLVMAIVMLLIFADRIERVGICVWKLNWPTKLLLITTVRARYFLAKYN